MALFLIGVVLLAYKWPMLALALLALRLAQWWVEVRPMAVFCAIPGCTRSVELHSRVCKTHRHSVPVGRRLKAVHQTHPCPIPGCDKRTAYGKLMCWDHWALTPTQQRKAVWASWNGGEILPSHSRDCMNAIDAVKGVIARKKI